MSNIISTRGNEFVGKYSGIGIINTSAAIDCPSLQLGLCGASGKAECYARKVEQDSIDIYKGALLKDIRDRADRWKNNNKETIFDLIQADIAETRNYVLRGIRVNAHGDLLSQEDIIKIYYICERLGIKAYGFTSRKDLEIPKHNKVFIRGSGFNTWCGGSRIFELDSIYNTPGIICPAMLTKFGHPDNRNCSQCKECFKNQELFIKFKHMRFKISNEK